MRLATIQPPGGSVLVAAAAAAGDSWVELAALTGRPPGPLENQLVWLMDHADAVQAQLGSWRGPRWPAAEVTFAPPVTQPPSFRDFYAFEQHVKTARARRGLPVPPFWYEQPVFYFSNPRALVGHGAPVHAPVNSQELDYELELGIVIGRPGRDIADADAWRHIAGLTVLNDCSARDLQRAEVTVGLGPAKAKDFATAVGPWLVTLDEFADRISGETLTLGMSARRNGRTLSQGNVSALYHSIPRLIAQASRDATLFPGDLIGTGTVGTGCLLELGAEENGGWLRPGDVVELEIERIGVLRTLMVARP